MLSIIAQGTSFQNKNCCLGTNCPSGEDGVAPSDKHDIINTVNVKCVAHDGETSITVCTSSYCFKKNELANPIFVPFVPNIQLDVINCEELCSMTVD